MQTIRPDEFYNSVITKVNTRKVCNYIKPILVHIDLNIF